MLPRGGRRKQHAVRNPGEQPASPADGCFLQKVTQAGAVLDFRNSSRYLFRVVRARELSQISDGNK